MRGSGRKNLSSKSSIKFQKDTFLATFFLNGCTAETLGADDDILVTKHRVLLYQIDIFQRSFFMVVILETEKINGNPVASLFESLFRIQDKAQYLTETFEIPVARFGL